MDKTRATVEIGGILFEREPHNGGLTYAHTDHEGHDWIALRPGLSGINPHIGTAHSWWTATVWGPKDQVRTLNSRIGHLDRPDDIDPLYYETDSGLTDPPTRLLGGMVRLIKETERHGLAVALGKVES